MKQLFNNKKGMDYFAFLVTIFGIISLFTIIIGVTVNYDKVKNHVEVGAGGKAAEILRTYEEANGPLLYLSHAAELSLREAAYDFASDGLYDADVSVNCNGEDISSVDYVLWSSGEPSVSSCTAEITRCIPADFDDFAGYFSDRLDAHINRYNEDAEVKILLNSDIITAIGGEIAFPESENYGLTFNQLSTGLQVVGETGQYIHIDKKNLDYKVLPTFSENIDIDLKGDFKKITDMAGALIYTGDKIIENENLRWDIIVEEDCSLACGSGGECNTNDCKIELDDPFCDDEENINLGGVICETTKVCRKSTWSVQYCERTAFVSVRIVDDTYKLPGELVGYKKIATENGQEDFTYKFALNWVEMGKRECM